MTDVLTVSDLGSALIARWKLVLAVTLASGLVGLAYGIVTPDTYTAKAVLIVMAGPANQDGYYQAAQFAEKRAATYPALVGSPEVLDPTLEELGLDMSQAALRGAVTATNPTDKPLVEVSADSSSPTEARDIADTAADNLSKYAIELEETGSRITTVTIQKAVPASEPLSPSSPSPVILLALGLLVGGALGVISALLARTWRGPRSAGGRTAATDPEPVVAAEAPGAPVTVTAHAVPAGASPAAAVEDADDRDPVPVPLPAAAAQSSEGADAASAAGPAAPAQDEGEGEADHDAVATGSTAGAADAVPAHEAPASAAGHEDVGDDAGGSAEEAESPEVVPVPRRHGLRALGPVPDPGSADGASNGRRRGPRGARRPITTAGTPYATDEAEAEASTPRARKKAARRRADDERRAAQGR